MDLNALRSEIDRIDEDLIRLFCERMKIAAEIAKYKKQNDLPVLDASRETAKLAKVSDKAGPVMAEYTASLFETLFTLSRSYQEAILATGETQNVPATNLRCGLLGRKLGHSYSPQIHKMLGGYDYTLFEVEPENLEDLLRHGDFTGINVTMPYKKAVIPYLDSLSPVAQKLSAVNTIVRREDGTLWGHNTDYYGFQTLLEHTGLSLEGKKVLVLGSGGASNTAVSVLHEHGAQVVVISRNGKNNYQNIHAHRDASLIVNATPVGMFSASGVLESPPYPHVDRSPVNLDLFPQLEYVLDLVYNPVRTKLVRDAEARSIPAESGLRMLVAQAAEACEYFMGKKLSEALVADTFQKVSLMTQNIILVGMPGCGKTTIGKLLADATGRKLLDSDVILSEKYNRFVPDIIIQDGLAEFRDMEHMIIREIASQSGIILSTGGGCVTEPRNYPLLHHNGIVFWLKRDCQKLPTNGRPLSLAKSPQAIYEERKALYEAYSDHIVDNNGTPEETVSAILSILEAIL